MTTSFTTLALLCLFFVGLTHGKHGKFPPGNKQHPPKGNGHPFGGKPDSNESGEGYDHQHKIGDVIPEDKGPDSSEVDLEKLMKGGMNNGNNFLSRLAQMAELKKKQKGGRKNSPNGDIEDGSGDDDDNMAPKPNKTSVVRTDEVKGLLGDISTIVEEVDMPLASLKSKLVDQVSMINNEQELAGFLKGVQERYEFPTGQFHETIMKTRFLITRLTEAGYETDPACLNLQREVKNMIPKSGKLPDDFHARFLSAYLMSVSCLSLDNALFHNDLAVLQDLDEGSKRDQVLAALSKVMIGSVRLSKKIAEQNRAVEMVRQMLPEAGVPNNTIIYKRLMD